MSKEEDKSLNPRAYWLELKTIKFKEALLGDYTTEYVAVSHRWEI